MSRNEARQVGSEIGASMDSMTNQAMTNPLGVITAFLLLGLIGFGIWLFKVVAGIADGLGPDCLLVPLIAAAFAGHRWIWGPLVDRRRARTITAGILVASLALAEASVGIVGLAFGKVTGFNPRAALMDAGYDTPESVRAVITNERERIARRDGCLAALKAGKMSDGTATSAIWRSNCKDYVDPASR